MTKAPIRSTGVSEVITWRGDLEVEAMSLSCSPVSTSALVQVATGPYADGFVIVAHGSREGTEALREDVARLLARMGLRLSPASPVRST